MLIGHDTSGISDKQRNRSNIRLASWNEILTEAEVLNLDTLATVLQKGEYHERDSRMALIKEFANDKLSKLIESLKDKKLLSASGYDGEEPLRRTHSRDDAA